MGARQFALFAAAVCLVAAVGVPTGWAATASPGTPTNWAATASPGTPIDRAGTAPTDSTVNSVAARTQMQQVTPDTVVLDVRVYENGTAQWEVVYRTRLDDPETTAAFRSYKADIENNSERYSQQFVTRMNSTIRSAEESTGREMTGTNYSVRAEIREFPQRYGLVVYSFKWHGFAATPGDRILIGDSLSKLILNDDMRLLVTWPDEYSAQTVEPKPETGFEKREEAVIWNGPIEFAGDEPRIVVSTPGTGWLELPEGLPWTTLALAAGGLGLVLALAGGGWWVYQNRDDEGSDPDDEPPEDLLSNEERVLRLLERRGGRVKQKAVVDELGWTEAKTSQVVGSLREQGKIESFRLGRENVLALAQEQRES